MSPKSDSTATVSVISQEVSSNRTKRSSSTNCLQGCGRVVQQLFPIIASTHRWRQPVSSRGNRYLAVHASSLIEPFRMKHCLSRLDFEPLEYAMVAFNNAVGREYFAYEDVCQVQRSLFDSVHLDNMVEYQRWVWDIFSLERDIVSPELGNRERHITKEHKSRTSQPSNTSSRRNIPSGRSHKLNLINLRRPRRPDISSSI
ncbi:hypothetical protein F4821DRAFT_201696 [Hypoxylon rubiginosum]|uniref:Uncharacterized protein n=1 Tax=Hypoxylon rubiginosum TaxID=110542 RepID=A0ACC0CRG8_9PEZI|nr:hypothetical protein F4821DRAFT_201696 [Hypoxylon rubiginosum]